MNLREFMNQSADLYLKTPNIITVTTSDKLSVIDRKCNYLSRKRGFPILESFGNQHDANF